MIARMPSRYAQLLALTSLLFSEIAGAATLTGRVTDGTNNKPSSGDKVALIDVQSGMAEVGSAITDSRGNYSITSPGMGTYLIRG